MPQRPRMQLQKGGGASADTNGGGQTVVCKIALHKKNVKLRNETLPLHKNNVKLHILFVTRPLLARPLLVSAEGRIFFQNFPFSFVISN